MRSSIILKFICLTLGFTMINEKKAGAVIGFEGIDGSGKSSAAKFLYDCIRAIRPAILTKEPGGTELGKHLREVLNQRTYPVFPEAEFLLFAADRAQHWREIVIPALQEGKVVISDRTAASSLAYQGYGRGVDMAMIEHINTWATCGMKPDLTIYLKIDYATAMSRFTKREKSTVFEQEREAFFSRLIEGFDTIFANRDDVIIVDASLPESEVQKMILDEAMGLQRSATGDCCGCNTQEGT